MKNEFIKDFSWVYKKFKKPIFVWYGLRWAIGALFFLYMLSTFVYVGYNMLFVEPKERAAKEYYSIEKYMNKGVSSGMDDGNTDWRKYIKLQPSGKIPTNYTKLEDTPWEQYKKEIKEYESLAQKEKEEYLLQFNDNERTEKLAEFRMDGGKFPSEKKLENVFGTAKNFYIDYVDKKQREDYASEDEYVKARRKEAWRVGYEYGYAIRAKGAGVRSQF